MQQVCYYEPHPTYKFVGGKGIDISEDWHPKNPEGFNNFATWMTEQEKTHGELNKHFLSRRDKKKDYSPENCVLLTKKEVIESRFNKPQVLTREIVISLRQQKRCDKKITLKKLATLYGFSMTAVYKAISGYTWQCLDDIEPPIRSFIRGV